MTAHGRIHFINFIRKLTVVSRLFLVPVRFPAFGFDGWPIGAVISFFALASGIRSFPLPAAVFLGLGMARGAEDSERGR